MYINDAGTALSIKFLPKIRNAYTTRKIGVDLVNKINGSGIKKREPIMIRC